MTKRKIVLVVGARPNFMKAAPLLEKLNQNQDQFETILIHTGQHYDHNLSQLFFDDLNLPQSDIYLGVGSGSHAQQTAAVMIKLEEQLLELKPDLTIVFGDINSTLATAVVTSKLSLKLAHVEAGLRSFDDSMPEEINRIVTDRLSDLLFVTEEAGMINLRNEGIPKEKIHLVGNIMIDSLKQSLNYIDKEKILKKLNLTENNYAVLTMHRPSNVDNRDNLKSLLETITAISQRLPVIFPAHPRTLKMIDDHKLNSYLEINSINAVEPMGYLDFLSLMSGSKFVITDSGGVQSDTTYMKLPCLTIRENTEHLVTLESGSNTLCGLNREVILSQVNDILLGKYKGSHAPPPLWDGQTAERIYTIIFEYLR